MKKKLGFVVFLLSLCMFTTVSYSTPDTPWGTLKLLRYYHDNQQDKEVLNQLKILDTSTMNRADQNTVANRLIRFGDYYLEKKNYSNAEAFYRKVLNISPHYWYIYNKIENIERVRGSIIPDFKNVFKQFFMVLSNFPSSFVLLDQVLTLLFYAGLLVFFIFGAFLFLKYFRLAGNDLIIDAKGSFNIKRAVVAVVLLFWPAFFLSGWMIYPFIISGLFWLYLSDNEKKAVRYMAILVGLLTFFYSIGLVLENNTRTDRFMTVQKVYSGHLYEKAGYGAFDNELKVIQALAYYNKGQVDTALDILNSTGDGYQSELKHNLLGNIYFLNDEFSESMNQYRKSLENFDKYDPVMLNNFTLALIKNKVPNTFEQYANAYRPIQSLRTQDLKLQVQPLGDAFLWKRVFSDSQESFGLITFLKQVFSELISLPIIYFILIFAAYTIVTRKYAQQQHIGESMFCSKCSKIIKEASVHRSYKLCDECYQLFSIRDVIFLEAKLLKEKELRKKFKKKYILSLFISLLIPGMNFSNKEKNRLFLNFSFGFYFLLLLALVGSVNFSRVFGFSPLFLGIVGVLAALLYLLINFLSTIGDSDGI